MPGSRAPLSLKARAIALLAQREHSVVELRRKLIRHQKAAAVPASRRSAAASDDDPASPRGRAACESALTEPAGEVGSSRVASTNVDVDLDASRGLNVDSNVEANIEASVDAVIAWLREHDYLDEGRFVESRVHARASRYGNLRIRQELAQHGLALDADAAHALKNSEVQRATDVWRRKFGQPARDAADKARQFRFLAQRGFSAETIARVMRQVGAVQRTPESDEHQD